MTTFTVNSKMTFKEIETAINAAKEGDTIYFCPGTYYSNVPEDRIYVKVSGITLNGAGQSTVLYGKPKGAWFDDKKTNWGYINLDNVSNVTISNIWFNSDCSDKANERGLYESRRCIVIRGGTSNTVHHCGTLGFVYLDFVSANKTADVYMHDCTVLKHGHTAFYAFKTDGGRVYNNTVGLYTNACLRVDGAKNIEFDHNTLYAGAGGQASWEFQNDCDGVDIHNNIISNIKYPLTQSLGAFGNVSFHDNVYWNCGNLQIGSGDCNINVTDPSKQEIHCWETKGYGCQTMLSDLEPEAYSTLEKSSGAAIAQVSTPTTESAQILDPHIVELLHTYPCILIPCENSEIQQELFDALKVIGLMKIEKMETTIL